MLHKLIAALGLIACVIVFAHMVAGPQQRARLEQWPQRAWRWSSRYVLWRLNAPERRRAARQEALAACQRAQAAARVTHPTDFTSPAAAPSPEH